MRGQRSLELQREVLVEPAGIGVPGAYVDRVASRVYNREINGLSDLWERSVNRVPVEFKGWK